VRSPSALSCGGGSDHYDPVPAIFAASLVLGRHNDAPLVMMATLVGSIAALGLAGLAMRRLRPGVLTIILPEYAAAT
jgi:hypothetical protein